MEDKTTNPVKAEVSGQILNESEMRSKPVRAKPQRAQASGSSKGIERLRAKLSEAESRAEKAEAKLEKLRSETPTIRIESDRIDFEYAVQVDKERYVSTLPIVRGEIVKYLLPVIAPFVRVANAALQRDDLRRLKEAHTRDSVGRTTREPLSLNGSQLFVTNSVDDLRFLWKIISADQECMSALSVLSGRVDEAQMALIDSDVIKMPGVTTADQHRNSYDPGDNVSSEVCEHKSVSPDFGR